MPEITLDSLRDSIACLEKKNRRLGRWVAVLAAAWLAALAGYIFLASHPPAFPGENAVLRVRGLVAVDENGVERVWIGAPVPEPLILGKRFPRGGAMSGVILFDEEGTERSGYCTSDGYPNVLFTLDAIGKQNALFMSEPVGYTTLRIWNGRNAVSMDVGEEAVSLEIKRDGKTVFAVPAGETDEEGGGR